ncbi:hypothetical protein [Photobacterium indicum]|uniref:hypothetical protein n=1 Tax=Photobacterium indicum TaxID=81447 RepID=UPI003D0E76DB
MKGYFFIVSILATSLLSGCATPKTQVITGADFVESITPYVLSHNSCEKYKQIRVEGSHPRNLEKDTLNSVYMTGATHYRVNKVTETDWRDRPTGYLVQTYICKSKGTNS